MARDGQTGRLALHRLFAMPGDASKKSMSLVGKPMEAAWHGEAPEMEQVNARIWPKGSGPRRLTQV
jgi:hypothetical protein